MNPQDILVKMYIWIKDKDSIDYVKYKAKIYDIMQNK